MKDLRPNAALVLNKSSCILTEVTLSMLLSTQINQNIQINRCWLLKSKTMLIWFHLLRGKKVNF